MTDEERRIISDFVQRIAGDQPAPARANSPWGGMGGGSVPSTQAQRPLPPVDREADQLITDLFAKHPEARYRITQTAFVQEAALVEAQNRIRQLEWEVENAQAQGQAQQGRGGLFGGMFGGGNRQPQHRMAPPPQPQYPPGYNPQQFQGRQGPGFLGTALMTAAGVAGGLVLGNMLMNSLGGGGGAHAAEAGGAAETGGAFGQEAVPSSSAWTDPGQAAADQGWGSSSPDATPASSDWGSGQDDVRPDAGGYSDGGYDDAGGGYEE